MKYHFAQSMSSHLSLSLSLSLSRSLFRWQESKVLHFCFTFAFSSWKEVVRLWNSRIFPQNGLDFFFRNFSFHFIFGSFPNTESEKWESFFRTNERKTKCENHNIIIQVEGCLVTNNNNNVVGDNTLYPDNVSFFLR